MRLHAVLTPRAFDPRAKQVRGGGLSTQGIFRLAPDPKNTQKAEKQLAGELVGRRVDLVDPVCVDCC